MTVSLLGLTIGSLALTADVLARSRHSRRGEALEAAHKQEVQAPPPGPLFMVVSIGKQHVSVYGGDGLVARAPISTGMPGHPTPTGIFNILEKERYHRSNIYSGAPMPFMQRITWSGVAMHAGVLPGYPASHGCIRMPGEFAKRLYSMTKGHERVIVTHGDVTPFHFAHPLLPVPKLRPLPGSGNLASGAEQMLQNAVAASAEKLDVAVKPDVAGPHPAEAPKLLNPLEYAKAMGAQAAERSKETAAASISARALAAAKMKEANAAAHELERAKDDLDELKDRIESLNRRAENAKSDETVEKAKTALVDAQAKLKDAQARFEAAQQAKADKDRAASEAIQAAKNSEAEGRAAAEAARSWHRRLDPVSIFISRKTQRLYVRQGFVKIFDIPVTIKDPEKPIGTHLYLAMDPDAGWNPQNPSLPWLALSLPESSEAEAPRRHHGRGAQSRMEEQASSPRQLDTSAAEALDRIEIPDVVSSKISEMLWAGGSLIVSDMGLSRETGDHTDFIILTR